MELKIISLALFIAAYVLFVIFSTKRTLIAVITAALIVIVQFLIFNDFLKGFEFIFTSINWNVMGLFIGMLFVADIFMKSKVPAYISEIIVNKSGNTAISIVLICALTGFISAFVENVATVLIVAPIALALAKKIKLNPMYMMIGIAVSSNLQGTATLIGDPPSMLLGGFANMNFFDFFFYKGKPSIFFAVELGAIFSIVFLYLFFRKHKEKAEIVPEEKVRSWFPSILLVSLIFLLAGSSFATAENLKPLFRELVDNDIYKNIIFNNLPGILCIIGGLISLVWEKFSKHKASIRTNIKSVDWDTTFFLFAIFIIVGSLTINGWIDQIAEILSSVVGSNIFLGYTIIVFLSIVLSAFIDNVPYLAAMLPVRVTMSAKLGINPSLLLFGLLIGASLGGNCTPIGASANIVACGLLKKEGINVSFKDFMKLGVPFTIIAVIPAYLLIWFIWS